MIKWFRERNTPQKNDETASQPTPSCLSPKSAVVQEALPSIQDRMLMLRAVLFAADTLERNNYGDKQRLEVVLQQDFTKNACIALHLVEEETEDDQLYCVTMANAASLDPTSLEMEQPYACITLLLSNIVLLYGGKGGYDARVRHSLKTACVHILYTHTEASLNETQNTQMQEFDESVGGIYRLVETHESSSNEEEKKQDDVVNEETKDENENATDDVKDDKKKESVDVNTETSTEDALATTDNKDDNTAETERQSHIQYIVTRKFELVERAIATRIFRVLMEENDDLKVTDGERTSFNKNGDPRTKTRKRVVRGLQITSVGVVAGTLFAVTGGLAGPAIAAGIAGLGVVSSATAATAIAMLTTVKAAAALFGLGGGGLAAYKMKKRTQGLTEFHIRRENIEQNVYEGASDESIRRGIQASLPQLHTTICISGWLKDKSDYQRPWGIQPTDPPIQDKMELLKRFFTVHDPELVKSCDDVIKQRKKRERKEFSWQVVWDELQKQYGRNPDHLLPLDSKDTDEITLTKEEQRAINDLLRKVVLIHRDPSLADQVDDDVLTDIESNNSSFESENTCEKEAKKDKWKWLWFGGDENKSASNGDDDEESASSDKSRQAVAESSSGEQSESETFQTTNSTDLVISQKTVKDADDTLVVWDWQALYGGDMHTVTWESNVLLDLCHVVSTMGREVTSQATKYALQFSVIGAIVAAVALPSALVTASQLIDDPYQIVILRADEAGVELAKCLLQSEERRPVTLVGYSFGSRVIYSCLMELARHQKLWEKKQGLSAGAEKDSKSSLKSESFLFRQEDDENDSFEYTREPSSIVEDVIFMGLPRSVSQRAFSICRQVAGGRMVNCYTKNDWFLSLMFIARAGTPCGTSPIEDVKGIENYNVTDLVPAHADYSDAVPSILQRVNFGKPNALSA